MDGPWPGERSAGIDGIKDHIALQYAFACLLNMNGFRDDTQGGLATLRISGIQQAGRADERERQVLVVHFFHVPRGHPSFLDSPPPPPPPRLPAPVLASQNGGSSGPGTSTSSREDRDLYTPCWISKQPNKNRGGNR